MIVKKLRSLRYPGSWLGSLEQAVESFKAGIAVIGPPLDHDGSTLRSFTTVRESRRNSAIFLRPPVSAGFIEYKKLRRVFVTTIDDQPQPVDALKKIGIGEGFPAVGAFLKGHPCTALYAQMRGPALWGG